jgi:hypothetical protein
MAPECLELAGIEPAGVAVFHLDDLGTGQACVLRAPLNDGGDVDSQVSEDPGDLRRAVGALGVTVLAGSDGRPLVDYRIEVREVVGGKLVWAKSGTSDQEGVLHLDLPGLGQGRRYRLEARSPIDGSRKYSDEITEGGPVTFVVGNRPLHLRAINGITGTPLAGVPLSLRELLDEEGKTTWINTRNTDDDGNVSFDVEGLGDGRAFVLDAKLANGSIVRAAPVSNPGDYTFQLEETGATLAQRYDGSAPPIERMVAYDRQ